jgi:GNAT superfamily N-acetyltransferase
LSLDVTVRPARPDEARFAIAILLEAAAWLESRGEPLWLPDEIDTGSVRRDVEHGKYVLAFAGEDAAGTARITPTDELFWPEALPGEALYVHRLAVRRRHAGGRVSSAILDFARAEARAAGCGFVRLDTDAFRPRLRRVYETFGFVFRDERVVGPHTVARYEIRV